MIDKNKLKDLQTGDILLFDSSDHWYDWLVKKFTSSYYSHSAMVLRDPQFLTEDKREGLYLIQSDSPAKVDVESNEHKFGVQIVPIDDIFSSGYDKVFIRRLTTTRDDNFDHLLSDIHSKVRDIPYDLNLRNWWIAGMYHIGVSKQMVKRHVDSFWCSALVSYLYKELKLIDQSIDWSNMAPSDLADDKFVVTGDSKLKTTELLYDFTVEKK